MEQVVALDGRNSVSSEEWKTALDNFNAVNNVSAFGWKWGRTENL